MESRDSTSAGYTRAYLALSTQQTRYVWRRITSNGKRAALSISRRITAALSSNSGISVALSKALSAMRAQHSKMSITALHGRHCMSVTSPTLASPKLLGVVDDEIVGVGFDSVFL